LSILLDKDLSYYDYKLQSKHSAVKMDIASGNRREATGHMKTTLHYPTLLSSLRQSVYIVISMLKCLSVNNKIPIITM